jgi:hypothetical protein
MTSASSRLSVTLFANSSGGIGTQPNIVVSTRPTGTGDFNWAVLGSGE